MELFPDPEHAPLPVGPDQGRSPALVKFRRWIALVTIPSVAVYVAMSYTNRYIYVEKAAAAAHAERITRSMAVGLGPGMFGVPSDPEDAKEEDARRKRATARADYFGRLRQKYEFAATFPFLPLMPEPTPPE